MPGNTLAADKLSAYLGTLLSKLAGDTPQNQTLAETLVWHDLIGRPAQGVARFQALYHDIREGRITHPCQPALIKKNHSGARLDGDNGPGQTVATQAMDQAMTLAREAGMGLVTVGNSHDPGTAAYEVQRAARQNLVALAFGTSAPCMAAHGGSEPVLGENRLAFAAPRSTDQPLLFEMLTTAPDPAPGLLKGTAPLIQTTLQPFAGAKGYCLAVMVEILAGILSGNAEGESGDTGQCFVAIDISRFMPAAEFQDRMEELYGFIKASGDDPSSLHLPGEARWQLLAQHQQQGITLDPGTARELAALGQEHGLTWPAGDLP
ncbi:MAG: Ldh family oxidoreductase [Gammaproteobacteria bacterium]|nr:Ldh family oxidoreductase [Gammaproteobacteria bacterium]